jgi:hypothetical protein
MKKHILSAAALVISLTMLPSCATDYYGGGGSYYDGYYDNFYGPVRYGYWGPDEYFYYSPTIGGPYLRDDAHHFRRDTAQGAHRFHMRGRPPGPPPIDRRPPGDRH